APSDAETIPASGPPECRLAGWVPTLAEGRVGPLPAGGVSAMTRCGAARPPEMAVLEGWPGPPPVAASCRSAAGDCARRPPVVRSSSGGAHRRFGPRRPSPAHTAHRDVARPSTDEVGAPA